MRALNSLSSSYSGPILEHLATSIHEWLREKLLESKACDEIGGLIENNSFSENLIVGSYS